MSSWSAIEAIIQDVSDTAQVSKSAFFRPIKSIITPITIAPIEVLKTRMPAIVETQLNYV